MRSDTSAAHELARAELFSDYWKNDLNDVFVDVAPYYDRANVVASLGLWHWFRKHFMSMVTLHPGMRVLDLCAGTNAVGIALLNKEPGLKVFALDRSKAMQTVGRQRATERGMHIEGSIGDVHKLPFPDQHFDMVTLQWASRHLRIEEVMDEVARVLKPGGTFHHCDMLRPANPRVAKMYFGYLRGCLNLTAWLFRSGKAALGCRKYFIDALDMFYSAEEFSALLEKHGFVEVKHKNLLAGMIGLHRAVKPAAA
jgi:demethylmenaquinone methyltransferase/2-methoxy-6-polyprenyl-1,4-benzoquinol methylase